MMILVAVIHVMIHVYPFVRRSTYVTSIFEFTNLTISLSLTCCSCLPLVALSMSLAVRRVNCSLQILQNKWSELV